MADAPQQTIVTTPFEPPVEAHEVPAEGWGTITRAWLDDLLTREFPASVVILIIVVIYLPKLLSILTHWIKRR